jgi:hypothetical protein
MRVTVKSVIFSLLITLLSVPTAKAAQVTSGLVVDINVANPSSYAGSGNTLTDTAGTANNGTVTGGTYTNSERPAIALSGTTSYIQIANTAELQSSMSNVFTLQVWAKVISYTANDGIMGKNGGSAYGWDGYTLRTIGTNQLCLFMNGNSMNACAATSASNVFSLNTWTLFSIVIDFGGTNRIYVNGTQVASGTDTNSSIPQPGSPIRIGQDMQDANTYPEMTMAAFSMYNRELSASEISDNYNYYLNYVPDSTAPTITSSDSFSVAENQTSIATLTASETSTWTLRASSDSATVNLNSSTGNLAFKTAPNFEVPTDANTDNVYQITVRATDTAGNYAELAISITVTNIDENSYATISFSSPPQKGINTVVTTSLNVAGTVSITVGGKRIPGCSTKVSSGSPPQVTCNWKPAVAGVLTLSARVTPTDQNYLSSVKNLSVSVAPRAGRR